MNVIELFSMHKTETGPKLTKLCNDYRHKERAALDANREYSEKKQEAKAVGGAANVLPHAQKRAQELDAQARDMLNEIRALSKQARLEDLSVWVMEKVKTTKKGSRTYGYWMASWRDKDEYSKVRNVHLGSCAKMDKETALQKARKIKAEYLGISA